MFKRKIRVFVIAIFIIFALCLSISFISGKYKFTSNTKKLNLDIEANYAVNFNTKGGKFTKILEDDDYISFSEDSATKIVEFNNALGTLPKDISKDNCTFVGWCTQAVPKDYVFYDSIKIGTKQYIDTGIAVNTLVNPTFETEFMMNNSGDYDWFSTPDNNSNTVIWNVSPPSTTYLRFGSTNPRAITFASGYNANSFNFTNGFHKLRIGDAESIKSKISISVDDVLVGSFNSDANASLVNAGHILIAGGRNLDCISTWKYFRIYDGDELICDMRPCKNLNDEYGMYDTVSKSFIKYSGPGNVSVGEVISVNDLYDKVDEDYIFKFENDIELFALWSGKVSKVNFVYNDASNSNGSTYVIDKTVTFINVNYSSTYANLPTPSREGYDFVGWFDSNDNEYKKTDDVEITEDITLTAKWKPKTYTITFDSQGGTSTLATKEVFFDSAYGTLPTASKIHTVFKGWVEKIPSNYRLADYISSNGTSYIDTGIKVSNLSKPIIETEFKMDEIGDKDWFGTANNTPNTILYNFQNDSSNTNFIRYGTTSAIGLSLSSGHSLADFNFTSDFHKLRMDASEGVKKDIIFYVDNEEVAKAPASESRSLDNTGTILIGKGRTGSKSSWKSFKIYDGEILLRDFIPCYDNDTNEFMLFDLVESKFYHSATSSLTGSKSNSSFAYVTTTSPYIIPYNSTVYADYEYDKYKVTLNPDSLTGYEGSVFMAEYGIKYKHIPVLSKPGYTFKGFQDESGNVYTSDDITLIETDITLNACWSVNKIKVNFNGNGGIPAKAYDLFEYKKPFGVLPTSTKQGVAFVGWSIQAPEEYKRVEYVSFDGSHNITTNLMVSSLINPTLEAEFKMNEFGDKYWFGTNGINKPTILWNFDPAGSSYVRWGTTANTGLDGTYEEGKSIANLDFRESFHKLRIGDAPKFSDPFKVYADDELILIGKQNNSRALTFESKIVIGGGSNNGSMAYTKADWKRFTIYDEGVKKIDLIPVIRSADNKYGLYDLVDGTFYTCTGLTGGEEVTTYEMVDSNTIVDFLNETTLYAVYKVSEKVE